MKEGQTARKPVFAGTFYPAEKAELENMTASFLENAPQDIFSEVSGLIVPHAGYVYSGSVAGVGYANVDTERLEEFDTVTVFLLAPAHRIPVRGLALSGVSVWETPLGELPVSPVSKKLAEDPLCAVNDQSHSAEHSIEVQLPFLQQILKGTQVELVPLLMTDADPAAVAGVIEPYLGENTLLCVSTDLSHYLPYEQALKTDRATIDAIKTFNFEGLAKENTACGHVPVLAAMHIARSKHWKFAEVEYKNSGDTAGDKTAVVGYVSMLMGVEGDE